MKRKAIDKNFDGHLEKELKNMSPMEKFDYIWKQIEIKNYISHKVKKIIAK
jgi:hypothetical protein